MGLRQSVTRLPRPSPNVPIFALTFRKPDTITLVLADDNVTTIANRVCMEIWKNGFEFIGKYYDDSYQIIFKGNPFVIGERREYAESIKRICSKLLSEFYAQNYDLILCSDLSRYTDYTTWFFEKSQKREKILVPPSVCCLSLSSTDSLQLFNGTDKLKDALRKTVVAFYEPGLQDERTYKDENNSGEEYYEIQLCGSPWFTTSRDLSISARKLILNIFRVFHELNFKYYASANLKGTADSIFFMQHPHDESGKSNEDQIKFLMLSLNGNNRLRLFNCSREIIQVTSKIITENWPHGLKQGYGLVNGPDFEYEMNGCPWWASDADAISSRTLLTKLFEILLSLGWRIVCSLDISRRVNDKSIFILQSRSPAQMRHFCMSFNDNDKIRIIRARPDVAIMIEKIILGNWPKGVKRQMDYCNSREIKLNGTLFESLTQNEASIVRVLMCYLINSLHANGCRIVASSDVSAKFHHKGSSGPNFPFDVHSWFVVKKD